MTDWFRTLMSGFGRVVQSTGANQSRQEQQAEDASRSGRSMSGSGGVAAALGSVAANLSSNNTELLVSHEFPVKFRQGGCDVFIERDQNEEPIRLRVKSLIYVYSDVVSSALLERKTAKIQAQINNYWNNRIPVTRTLTLTPTPGGTLAFSYDDLPVLSVGATGIASVDAMAFRAQWLADPDYDPIGHVEVDANGVLLVTFIDATARVFTDASTNGASISELVPTPDPDAVPVGTHFKAAYEREWRAMGEIGDKYAPPRPHPDIDIVFEFEAKSYTFASPLSPAGRTEEMNRLRDAALREGRNLLWIHLNDNDDQNVMTSWASGGLGSFRVNAWPGEYAHEAGHFMGHWTPRDPVSGAFDPAGEHSTFNSLMGRTASKSLRRVDQFEVDCLNFSRGLGGTPSGTNSFPGTILRERLLNERKTVGHTISAQIAPRTFVRDQVIYLDMSNFATAKPEWIPGD
jgi:hypothetical protein